MKQMTGRSIAVAFLLLACILFVSLSGKTWSSQIVFESVLPKIIQLQNTEYENNTKAEDSSLQFKSKRVDFEKMRREALRDRKAIYLSRQETPPFDPAFKNPCWWYKKNQSLACLPYFYLAGFPKSGTTDLYSRLTSHPLVSRGKMKEPHYVTRRKFSAGRENRKFNSYDNTSIDIIKYAKKYFDSSVRQIRDKESDKIDWSKYQGNKQSKKTFRYPSITVDASASTAWDNSNGLHIIRDIPLPEHVLQYNASIIDWLVRMNPNVRIVLIMREPVSRVYSGYNYFRKSTSPNEFSSFVDNFLKKYYQCIESGYSPMVCTKELRIHIGLYHLYIEEWLARIPRERIHVIRTEDYHTNMSQSLCQVFDFLGLPQLSEARMKEMVASRQKNVNRKAVWPMLPKTREKLIKFYQPFNEKLAKLLSDNRFLWQDVYNSYTENHL